VDKGFSTTEGVCISFHPAPCAPHNHLLLHQGFCLLSSGYAFKRAEYLVDLHTL